jgi:acetyltransferase-like isoleucine patch superfamily enzyme
MQSVPRRMINRILQLIARFGPGANRIRPFIHMLRGVKLGKNVWIGEEVLLENNYPDHIEIGDETQLAMQVIVLTHFRGPGRVIIGPRVWVGTRSLIAAAHNQILTIGEGSVIGAGSVVTRDVPPFTFVAGSPAKPIARVTVPMTLSTTYEEFKTGLQKFEKQL